MNLQLVGAIALMLIGAVAVGLYPAAGVSAALAQPNAYAPPSTQEGSEGWLTYVDAPEIGPEEAASLNPALSSPEAAVVKFLASRMRADTVWTEALVAKRSKRLERQIAEWEDWQIAGFQLRARKPTRRDGVYLRVFFRITVNGDADSGTDEFEVVREGNEWRIAAIPA